MTEKFYLILKEREWLYIRIGITGSHGTGKTVLAKQLSKIFNLPYIEEQARISCKALGIKDLDEARKDNNIFSNFQQDIIRRQINEEYKHQYTGFISDRTTADNYAYYYINTEDAPIVRDAYEELALYNYNVGYDLVIYVPIMFSLEDDGLRNKGEKYRELVDKTIREYLYRNSCVYIVTTEGIENRINELVEVINNQKKYY